MKAQKPLCLLALTLVLVGCATNPASPAKTAGMRTVQVERRVDARQGMRYGVDLSGGGLANALASMITDSAGQKGITRMSEVMHQHQIVVPDLVRERAIQRLGDNQELTVVDDGADGVFVFKIQQYGFDSPGLKFSRKCPIILLQAELHDRNGRRVWRNENAPIQLKSEGMGATWDEYEAQPEKLREDWIKQIDHVLAGLLRGK